MSASYEDPSHHLHQDAEWLRLLLATLPHGLLVERNGCIVYINDAYAALLGASAAELAGREVGDFIGERDRHRLIDYGRARASFRPAPTSYAFDARRVDGREVAVQASVQPVMFLGQLFILTQVQPLVAEAQTDIDAALIAAGLSPREAQVARMTLEGQRLKEIAFQLGISLKTVSTHRTRLLVKLGVPDVHQLYRLAIRRGYLSAS